MFRVSALQLSLRILSPSHPHSSLFKMELEQTPVDTSSSWAWRLDQASSSSSTAFVSTDPLSSLSKTSPEEGASDEIFWQDFRPARSRPSRRDRKRARLSRFDSDEEDESGAQVDAADAAESEEDEASGLGQTSSEGSVTDDEHHEHASSGGTALKVEAVDGNTNGSATIDSKASKQSDTSESSTHLIARAIHRHALADGNADQETLLQHPSPLTYKETVRLVRLIAMIFRFPKSSRRIVRRRHRSTDPTSSAASTSTSVPDASTSLISTASTSTSSPADASSSIELKPKYLASNSRRPRILARVHPDDAHPSSPAVLKLIALIPVALPSRVACVEWVVDVAVQARRDEYGNILLPNTAYQSGAERDGSVDVDGDVKKEEEGGAKVTRSMRQRLAKEVMALPFPEFWRRRSGRVKDETPDVTVEEQDALSALVSSDQHAEAPVATSSQDLSDNAPSSSPAPSTDETPRVRVHNLSKLLAERMRDKRQAKTLLLRTHQSLRKRSSGEDDSVAAGETAATEEEEEEEVDAETLANTIANSARVNARAAVLSGAGEEDGDVTIKQEDV